MALLENLALGVPCLVSNAIHIARTLASAGAAVLTPLHETELARALVEFGNTRTAVAERGRALVSDTFNWSAVMPRFTAALATMGLR